MRVVIDTNILVSAVIRDRLPERVSLCGVWAIQRWNGWSTPAIIAEYIAVIHRPKFKLPKATVAWWLELLAADTQMIQPTVFIDFPRDRKDGPFLICAEPVRPTI